ncbi:hypothetical protein SANTM175S_05933 [Streptomyces antimycoticus]
MDMTPNRRLLAIADDLSGAAEVAAALHSRTTRSRVVLVRMSDAVSGGEASSGVASALRPRHPGEATVLDLDSRYRPAAEAAEAVRDALRLSSPDGEADGNDGDTLVLKKIDSLLRGNVAAEIAALAEGGAGVVLAPALPIAGRVVRSGVVHIGGVALHEGDAWRAETLPPPGSVAQALGGLPIALIPLTTVRASPPPLRGRAARGRGGRTGGDLRRGDGRRSRRGRHGMLAERPPDAAGRLRGPGHGPRPPPDDGSSRHGGSGPPPRPRRCRRLRPPRTRPPPPPRFRPPPTPPAPRPSRVPAATTAHQRWPTAARHHGIDARGPRPADTNRPSWPGAVTTT